MRNPANWAVVQSIVQQCTTELFDCYGLTIAGCSPGPLADDDGFVAVIGFTGDNYRGSLAISASTDTIHASNVITACPTPEQDRDWTGELANQLLGRVKNRLLTYGAMIQMGTPMVFGGRSIRRWDPKHAPGLQAAFQSAHGRLEVWMDGVFTDGFVLEEAVQVEEAAEEEGTFLFF